MTLNKGFFVSTQIHSRKVKLPDGSEHELHFKELPAVEFRRFQIAEQSDNEEIRIGAMMKMIAFSLCDANGKPVLSHKKAMELNSAASNALASAVLDVNGMGKRASGNESPSEDRTGSTTS